MLLRAGPLRGPLPLLLCAPVLRLASGASRGHEVLSLATGAAMLADSGAPRVPGLRGSAGLSALKDSVGIAIGVANGMCDSGKVGCGAATGSLAMAVLGLALIIIASGIAAFFLYGGRGAASRRAGKTVHCDAQEGRAAVPLRPGPGGGGGGGAGALLGMAGAGRPPTESWDVEAAELPGLHIKRLATSAAARVPSADDVSGPDGLGARVAQRAESDSSFQPAPSVLCPGLVVRQPGGMALALLRLCAPGQPNEVIEARNVDGNREVVGRAIVSECAGERGVIVESSLRLPIAFLQLKGGDRALAGASGGACATERYIAVSRAAPPPMCGLTGGPPFCTVRQEARGDGFVMLRGAGEEGSLLLLVRPRVGGAGAGGVDIVDGEGRALATVEEAHAPEASARSSLGLLHVCAGVDAGLIMVAVLAVRNLR